MIRDFTFQAYQRGAGGVASVTNPLITPTLTRYSHSISATGGFESCQGSFSGTLDHVAYWLSNGVGATLTVYGPDAELIWEGLIVTVSAVVGGERIDLSLEKMANAVKVRYQPDIGAQVSTTFATNTVSIATYGRKEHVRSGSGMTNGSAVALRNTILDERKYPLATRSSDIQGSAAGAAEITLTAIGWYYTLDWLVTSDTTTSTAVTTTQVGSLLTDYNSVNNFFDTSTANITASGLSDTQYIDEDTTYRSAIEKLLNLGNSSNQRQAWGTYEGRAMTIKAWAGATPTVITYQRRLVDRQLYAPGGGAILPWLVRPDTMYQVIDLIDAATLVATADNLATYYIERVSCTVDASGSSLRLEPAQSGELDVLLARLR